MEFYEGYRSFLKFLFPLEGFVPGVNDAEHERLIEFWHTIPLLARLRLLLSGTIAAQIHLKCANAPGKVEAETLLSIYPPRFLLTKNLSLKKDNKIR